MGLMQKACLTYDCHKNLVGVLEADKEPLAPCSHKIAKADLEITVDQNGKFVKCDAFNPAERRIIPVTEASASRTSTTIAPHALCEQLRYLLARNEAHYSAYTAQLTDWAKSPFSHPKLGPILAYVEGQTILVDLMRENKIKMKDGLPENEKLIVSWRVIGLGEENSGPCWNDPSLFQAFDDYYQARKAAEQPVVCMVSGEVTSPARQHMKGVVSIHGNAKLISSNDTDNFTFRGRFSNAAEAATVGYAASQKAHNALHWLAANQKVLPVNKTSRCFLCWEPEQIQLPQQMESFLLPGQKERPPARKPSDYQEALEKTLSGWKSLLPDKSAQAVIAAFDAATSGRLSVTYYNELMASDFLERLYEWDRLCCWPNGKWGIQAPSIWKIVRCAYGTQRIDRKGNPQLEVPDQLLCSQAQRLLSCRIDQARMPSDLVHRLIQRVSTPLAYHRYIREEILFTACAVIRKYHFDTYKEEWTMALEPEKRDRSYQYGRLLAVLDKMERDTYDKDEKRDSNAMRMMSVFAQRPQYAARIIWERVRTAYYPRLHPGTRVRYDKLLQEIYGMLSQCDETELNRPLGDTYPLGYYLQRKALFPDNSDNNNELDGGNE